MIDQLSAQSIILYATLMPRWFFVKFLWEVQSLDNSVTQQFYEDEASCSRDIQVRLQKYTDFQYNIIFTQFRG